MPATAAQAPSGPEGAHLVLFDGVCGLCDRLVQFLLRHDRRAVFVFAPLQSEVGQRMVAAHAGWTRHLTGDQESARAERVRPLTTFYVIANWRTSEPRALRKSDAALFVARELGWPWKALCAARIVPKVLRDAVYDIVARTRYRVFGRVDQCLIPRAEHRSRFVE
jgi:predicted DCC family thiol-disulfide oxidoreductase YuxK